MRRIVARSFKNAERVGMLDNPLTYLYPSTANRQNIRPQFVNARRIRDGKRRIKLRKR